MSETKRDVNRAGFTFIEMLIVLVIAAVLLGIGMRPLTRELQAAKIRGAVDQFVSAHAFAKATAIRHSSVGEFHIDASTARFWIEVDTSNGGGVNDTVRTIYSVGEGGLVMTSNRSLVCFDGRGLATTAGTCEAGDFLVTFFYSFRTDTVTASSLGKILR